MHEVLTMLEPDNGLASDHLRRHVVDPDRLAPAIDDDEISRTREDRREHRESHLEARHEVAVKRIHEDVRAGVNLWQGYPGVAPRTSQVPKPPPATTSVHRPCRSNSSAASTRIWFAAVAFSTRTLRSGSSMQCPS